VKSVLERLLGRIKMDVIRRHDCDKIHALSFRKLPFLLNHFIVGAIYSIGWQVEGLTGLPGFFRVAAKSATNQLYLTVHPGGYPVNIANKGALAAADHTHA